MPLKTCMYMTVILTFELTLYVCTVKVCGVTIQMKATLLSIPFSPHFCFLS